MKKNIIKILSVFMSIVLAATTLSCVCLAADEVDEFSPLYDKSALFCGDSISHGQWDSDTGVPTGVAYAGRIGDLYGMAWVDNQSWGGTSISDVRGANGRILNQVNNAKNRTYDYVILQGGVNDAWGNIDTGEPALPGEMSNSYDVEDFDISTFAGGLEELFYYALQYFPEAKIGYIITFATPNATGIGNCTDMEPYYSVAIDICEKWGINYLDLYHDKYVSETLMAVNTYQYLKDPIHPNKKGYDRLAPYIGEWMEVMCDNSMAHDNPLNSKTALFVGDSISYGHHDYYGGEAWARRISTVNGMRGDNYSSSGATISTARPGGGISQQLKDAAGHSYEYVIMQGGINDAWENVEVGDISDSYDKADFDRATFGGALEYMFATATELYPDATLGFIYTFSVEGTDMEEHFALADDICEKWGVAVLDWYHDDEITAIVRDMTNMADAAHPNGRGYDRLFSSVGEWMATLNPFRLMGDMDDNEKITASDALTVLQAAVGKIEPTVDQALKAEMDHDNKITASDALYVLQIAVGKRK